MATVSTTPTAMDDDILYEVINGEVVEIPPMGALETLIASLIDRQLQCYVAANDIGWIVPEMLFDFSKSIGHKRRPDLAFVSFDRWPRDKQVPRTEAWEVVPNLAVEVISTTNTADYVVDKVADYFQVGVELVWVVYPSQQQVYVYSSPTELKILAQGDELVVDALLPDFRLPLGALFDDAGAGEP
jgi:Uma2 family endonuclease